MFTRKSNQLRERNFRALSISGLVSADRSPDQVDRDIQTFLTTLFFVKFASPARLLHPAEACIVSVVNRDSGNPEGSLRGVPVHKNRKV
jgi:hypothetical protein